MKTDRKITFHKHYFMDFYMAQSFSVQEKIEYVFKIVRTVDKVPKKFLDYIAGSKGIYEIRVELGSNIYRIFCCFDKENLIILFNAFQKKSQKTPKQEIELAEKLKREYFENK